MNFTPKLTALVLNCPNCGADIDTEEVNIPAALARCTACRTVFSLADPSQATRGTRLPASPRAEVPLPPAIRVDQWGHELVMSRRWFTPAVLFLVFFCIAWDSFLVFWYSIALSGEDTPWIMIVFPVAHVAVGIGLTYLCLASLFNKTRIRVAGGELSVRHGPIPWRGRVRLATADIEQIFCTEKVVSGENRQSSTYRVNAMLTDGRKIELLSGLPEADQALYIEQMLEDHLGITDRPVGGELPR
ncbi:MAG TPA: hypothetical protein PL151_07815 [Phycisphaerae bacterium]|nr:hypothetical protein [Phycisphaerae bacterium]HOJ75273.1 hypothetical protein [Phycisphaerae bacterium]HOM53062.1 hypothetical protein [Phycisphaerae bacterium]HOQ88252.1 hypothetical protein [Phycisphaerae bacterium]HPP28225.1 hypothetical protein [Phycisphaerae bacterium]